MVSDADLLAFVDGELDGTTADAVRAHLRTHPASASRVETWRRQNAAIRRAFDPIIRPPLVPLSARPADNAGSARAGQTTRLDLIRTARQRRRAMATIAAFLGGACVALLGAIAFNRAGLATDRSAAEPIAAINPDTQGRRARLAWRTYSEGVNAADDRSTSAEALQAATALPRIPDLSRDGFAPIARRLMPGLNEPAAFLLYESSAPIRVALTVERSDERNSAPVVEDDGALRTLSWRARGFAVSLVGPADLETLRALARDTVAALAR